MYAVNYDAVLAEMRGAGLVIEGGLQLDSDKPKRCRIAGDREQRGWYRLTTIEIDGERHIIGAYGIWRGNDNGKISVRPGRSVKLTYEQRAAITERIAADNRRAKAARAAEAERAAYRAAQVWRAYRPDGRSAYLARKGVGAYGIRYHPSVDTIAVPMLDPKGKLWGLQLIRGDDLKAHGKAKPNASAGANDKANAAPNGDHGRAPKREILQKQYWPKGLDKVGHYHLIGGSPRDLLIIAEGYATAATLHDALSAPVAVAFDAGNLLHVAKVLRRQYPRVHILIGADDDYRSSPNTGIEAARAAALAIDGRWLAPIFSAPRPVEGPKGATDWNDLAALEGLATVRAQLEGFLAGNGWAIDGAPPRRITSEGGGESAMAPRLSVDEAALRYWGTYGFGGKLLFDEHERRLVHKDDVINLLPRHGWESLKDHPDWRVARDWEIGFDPARQDRRIRCNLFAEWPTEPKEGQCDILLELLEYLCSQEPNGQDLYHWVLDWLAYPIQHPGAKMHSALVVHGPQGTGKNLFFESIVSIYGEYGRVLGQEALEDKFNSDWAEKKLFILADEILARQDMFHVKNRLKSFITGQTIRVNPKNIAAHNEKNCMNIVFLSNERMPVVLENDDRRHCVIWSPPKLPASFFDEVVTEIANGAIAALHHRLLQRDLSHFTVASRPPMTEAKADLIHQGLSSEERFVQEWIAGELETPTGLTLPCIPCLGADLYAVYRRWCERQGERARRSQDLIGHANKQHGWSAGRNANCWRSYQDRSIVKRKLVIPGSAATEACISAEPEFARYRRERYDSDTAWHSHCSADFRDLTKEELSA